MIRSASAILRRTALAGLPRRPAVLMVALCLFFVGCAVRNSSSLQARNGVLDLSGWDFDKDGITNLNGEWEFYWGRLLEPADFASGHPPDKDGYIELPCTWNGYELNGEKLGGKGHATFRLLMRLNGRNGRLSLAARDFLTASRIWVNGELSLWNGTVGDGKDGSDAECRPGTAGLAAGADTVEIVLQVSNYHSIKGGPNLPICIGTGERMEERRFLIRAVDVFVISVLLIMALYHFVLYLFRREYKPVLYFAVASLFLSFNHFVLGVNGRLITVFFKGLPFGLLCRLESISWYVTVPLIGMFLASLYAEQFSRHVIRAMQLAAVVCIAITVLMPLGAVERAMPVYAALTVGGVVYCMYVLLKAFARRMEGAPYLLAGFACFFVLATNDLFVMNGMGVPSVALANIGWLACIVFQSFALSSIFAKSFRAMEENLRLRNEIAARKRAEREQNLLRIRLSEMLNAITEAVIAVNENGEICYLNNTACTLTGCSPDRLIGKDVDDIFADDKDGTIAGIKAHIARKAESRMVLNDVGLKRNETGEPGVDLNVSTLVLEDELLFIFILRKHGAAEGTFFKSEALIEELNRNRERLLNFEESLSILSPENLHKKPELLSEVKIINTALEHVQEYLLTREKKQNKKVLAVKIVKLAIDYWNECTDGSGKTAMAEKSGIWSVYVDKDGGKRTQGLDKYLSLKTISKFPQWKRVTETADFVLFAFTDKTPVRLELEKAVTAFRIAE